MTGQLALNNQKRDTAHTVHDVSGRDSLDIEVAQKVAMTLAALCGAYSFWGQEGFSGKVRKDSGRDFAFSPCRLWRKVVDDGVVPGIADDIRAGILVHHA